MSTDVGPAKGFFARQISLGGYFAYNIPLGRLRGRWPVSQVIVIALLGLAGLALAASAVSEWAVPGARPWDPAAGSLCLLVLAFWLAAGLGANYVVFLASPSSQAAQSRGRQLARPGGSSALGVKLRQLMADLSYLKSQIPHEVLGPNDPADATYPRLTYVGDPNKEARVKVSGLTAGDFTKWVRLREMPASLHFSLDDFSTAGTPIILGLDFAPFIEIDPNLMRVQPGSVYPWTGERPALRLDFGRWPLVVSFDDAPTRDRWLAVWASFTSTPNVIRQTGQGIATD